PRRSWRALPSGAELTGTHDHTSFAPERSRSFVEEATFHLRRHARTPCAGNPRGPRVRARVRKSCGSRERCLPTSCPSRSPLAKPARAPITEAIGRGVLLPAGSAPGLLESDVVGVKR